MVWPADAAIDVRDKFGIPRLALKVDAIAMTYGYVGSSPDNWEAAYWLGHKLCPDSPIRFADELLCPLYILEPMICYGRKKTGRKKFFGLIDEKVPYSNAELGAKIGCSASVIGRQCYLLL